MDWVIVTAPSICLCIPYLPSLLRLPPMEVFLPIGCMFCARGFLSVCRTSILVDFTISFAVLSAILPWTSGRQRNRNRNRLVTNHNSWFHVLPCVYASQMTRTAEVVHASTEP